MKNIKTTLLLIVLVILGAKAQDTSVELFSIPLSNPGQPGKLIVEQIAGSITVAAHDGREVIVKASFGNKKAHYKDDKPKNGMKRISNSSLSIGGEEKDNVVQIINEQYNRTTNLDIKVPKNCSLKLKTVNEGNIDVEGVNGEFEISNVNGEVTLLQVNGSASIDTVNGDIKVVFNSIAADANMAFSSLNGDLDVTFPKSIRADMKLRTDMGEILTDFDMKVIPQKTQVETSEKSDTYKVKLEQWVRGEINGGGPEMLFKTWNGDILIRAE
ncbi:hypothetical protein FK220_003605 [Flavobacteriaceae bacterium TP-CH-4]|uniref:Adhesin domain-containing protein n=1 Tax=Pelagihabitans pacificus TaxID=2696054 RepID=A0A967E5B9_9FLAO|nr:DUF4097 family beta strand repeat-containing protein [Pelagihabitans pacificus]NHF58410.1 hypothetical protein [Pelagihabitans pacificus]